MNGHITSDSEAQMVASRYINLAHMQTRGLDLGYLYVRLEDMAENCDSREAIPYWKGYGRVANFIRREAKKVLVDWRKERAAQGDKEAQALLNGTYDPNVDYDIPEWIQKEIDGA